MKLLHRVNANHETQTPDKRIMYHFWLETMIYNTMTINSKTAEHTCSPIYGDGLKASA